jgi:hypothetical protein
MGYSMVTKRYHYVEWHYWDNEKKAPTGLAARELYDLNTDQDENINIADMPENKEILKKLSLQLKSGWQEALPRNKS